MEPISHNDLILREFPPTEYVVDGIIPTGLTLLVGSPKAGKSWLALALAHAAATGTPVLGGVNTGRPRPVFYAALEDGPQRLLSRLTALGINTPAPTLDYWVDAATVMDAVKGWLEAHRDEHPLVILDTLGRIAPPARAGESDFQRDYRVGAVLKDLADGVPGGSLVVVHHTRKAHADDFLDLVSGTQGLAGAADTIVVLRRTRNDSAGSLAVTSRDAAEGEYAVTFDSGSWTIDGTDLRDAATALAERRATEGLGERSAEVVAIVNRHPEGIRASEVADQLGMTGKDAGTYLLRAFEAGRINRPTRGLYTPVGSVESVESEGASPTHPTLPTPSVGATCRICGTRLLLAETIAAGICSKTDDLHAEARQGGAA